jgi:hypothetical protein
MVRDCGQYEFHQPERIIATLHARFILNIA